MYSNNNTLNRLLESPFYLIGLIPVCLLLLGYVPAFFSFYFIAFVYLMILCLGNVVVIARNLATATRDGRNRAFLELFVFLPTLLALIQIHQIMQ